jgi:putative salt-induced outer membrane protein
MKYIIKITLLGLFLLGGNVLAQDGKDPDHGWHGKGELGYVDTSGNTESTAFNLALEILKNTKNWRYRFGATALLTSKNGDKDTERYSAELQGDRKLSEKSYIFAAYRYDSDKFGAYDPQQSVTAGYGRELIKTENHQLKGEIGVGYKKSEERLTGVSSSEAIARFLLEDAWQVFSTTTWNNRLLVETGSDNTFTLFNTGVVVSMTERFALKVGWEYRHNSTIPLGTVDKTDTTTSANLVYNF